ncbi:MAG: 2-amino-3,7-dideoxy-D-threo-hept-6-ulosonate synthase [Desulfovibrio sp.]|jgi:class I fructose-bisphosphate aldolase|nr:2-amino-3,7-dideoxy-D-threo-hept-6-ulosonate synthase [Desulfovibrio sp.]
MYLGKQIRLERIINRNNGRTIIVPMDHGVSMGALPGLIDMKQTVDDLAEGGADAVLMHKGLIRCGCRHRGNDIGLIMHLSASTDLTPSKNAKALVGTVEEAIRHGADAVSCHVNLGDPDEAAMLSDLGRVAEACDNWGMPLIAMVYGRGPKIANSYAPEVVAHCARVGNELGADIVKVSYTGDPASFADVVAGCCVPVVIAGGPVMDSTRELLTMIHDSLKAGGAGCSIGRNVFEHPRRTQLVRAMRALVHEDADIETAMKIVGDD